MKESPIFTRTHDLLLWLLATTRKFPREQRFVLAQRLLDQAFQLQEVLIAASLDRQQQPHHLLQADIVLTSLRKTLLLCQQLNLLSSGQFLHVSQMTTEVGRMLGSWQKSSRS